MTREELREQLLKHYDVKTIVDRLFWNPDREKFLKELSDYQRSILERFFNPNKRFFQAYLKEQTLPYEEWNHYKEALDRAISLKEDILSRLFQRIEKEREKKRKTAKARRTSRVVYDGDDDLLTKAFLLFLLYEVLKGNDTVKGDELEFTQEQDNQDNKENLHLQQEQAGTKQAEQEQLSEETETTESNDSQIDRENTQEPENRLFEDNTVLPDKTDSQYNESGQDNTEFPKNYDSSDSFTDSHSSRDYDFSDSFGGFDSGSSYDSYDSGSDWDSGGDW